MKIIYFSHFNLNGPNSHHIATLKKLVALKALTKELIVISSRSNLFKVLEIILVEIKCLICIYKYNPDAIISRGYVGYFAQKYAKKKGIKTIREVHADLIGEIQQYDKNFIEKKILIPFAYLSQLIDLQSDVRIFNHPYLLSWFHKKFNNSKFIKDTYVYNGFDFNDKSKINRLEARKKFNLKENTKYIIFTGGAKYWHGINYLTALQDEFNSLKANIQIICGGGKVSKADDPKEILLNFSPLDSKNCSDLICASDACILPVRQSRVSPGNALKLYDYFLHKKFVITQNDLEGYSDEVQKYKYGMLVNFDDAKLSASRIINELNNLHNYNNVQINIDEFCWESRITQWLHHIR